MSCLLVRRDWAQMLMSERHLAVLGGIAPSVKDHEMDTVHRLVAGCIQGIVPVGSAGGRSCSPSHHPGEFHGLRRCRRWLSHRSWWMSMKKKAGERSAWL